MEKVVKFNSVEEQRILFGSRDRFLRQIREHFKVQFSVRNLKLKIAGDVENVLNAQFAVIALLDKVRNQKSLSFEDVENTLYGLNLAEKKAGIPTQEDWNDRKSQSSLVSPMTDGQRKYIEAIQNFDVVFSIGPAGTGKTFLATALAVDWLHRRRVRKIVLVRPAVEAGEKLGFLPGDMQQKINPYLRPVFDALENVLNFNALHRYLERDIIEVAPLAFMRGRTLDNAFIILDEAQNTTPKQMKMFLTRFGRNSKVVVTGDITQVDLEKDQISGLIDALNILTDIEGIKFVELTEKDIVRHPLVQRIVNAYEKKSVMRFDNGYRGRENADTNEGRENLGNENGS